MDIKTKKRGHPVSEELKKRYSVERIGSGNPMWGRKQSVETRLKRSNSMKGKVKSPEARAKLSKTLKEKGVRPPSRKGAKHTEEVRKRMSAKKRGILDIDNYDWSGNWVNFKLQIRKSYEYRVWRGDVFKRDNYTCVCGKIGGDLEVHHIKPFSDILVQNGIKTFSQAVKCNELWDINNGVTLCLWCHKRLDINRK
jgi:hypothetical protein